MLWSELGINCTKRLLMIGITSAFSILIAEIFILVDQSTQREPRLCSTYEQFGGPFSLCPSGCHLVHRMNC